MASCSVAQVASDPQRPLAHTPDVHAIPHPPQWRASVWRFTSHPLAAFMSQSAKPVLHAIPHVPALHVAVAFAPPGHVRPHTPQLAVDVRVSASHPLAAFMSQSPKPVLQARPQRPAAHVADAFAPLAQAVPQELQLRASVLSATSQPLAGFVSQSPKPGLQVYPQRPVAHVRVALITAGHALPHAPQSVTSFCVSVQVLLQRC
jgi:hypothetical protein